MGEAVTSISAAAAAAPSTRTSTRREWTRAEIASRILAGENLVIYRSRVLRIPYNWLAVHPGSDLAILHFIGRDATDEIEAYHCDETLKRINGYTVGFVNLDEEGWDPLVPPIMSGWTWKEGKDGRRQWICEAQTLRAVDTGKTDELNPSSQILLVKKEEIGEGMDIEVPTLETLSPPPSTLSRRVQAQHSAAYKELHKRIVDAGLYETPFITGYGPEVVRYTLFILLSIWTYHHGWYIASAFFLGLFWHQAGFAVHDLGHRGVTHNWTVDRLIGICIADFMGGLSIGWWVDNHNVHHLVTNHPSHDPDIEYLPFFAITPAFFNSLYSSYYKIIFPFDAASKILIPIQHKLFYIIMALARFNLYALSYGFLLKSMKHKPKERGGRWSWWLEVIGIAVFWVWYSRVLRGTGSWRNLLLYLLVSNVTASPLHVQIVLSHFSRSTADLGPVESFPHRQLRTTTDVICPESLGFIHGGLHLQVTHHLFPRLPRHNLKKASKLVKEFAREQGLEYAEFGFVEGNMEVRGVLRAVAEQVKVVGMVAGAHVKEAMEAK